jgi:hypothetical protein
MRPNSGRCDERRSGRSSRSATAASARRAVISRAATWPRHTDATSRSMSSGAAISSPARRSRARRPAAPSSPSATAKTLASTTITFCPNVTHRRVERHPATLAYPDALKNLFQSRLTSVGDQTASEVLLQGLMRACGTLPKHSVSVLGYIFDLHTWNGAILAPLAPKYKLMSRRCELDRQPWWKCPTRQPSTHDNRAHMQGDGVRLGVEKAGVKVRLH